MTGESEQGSHIFLVAGLGTNGRVTIWKLIDGDYQEGTLDWLDESMNSVKEAEDWENVVQVECDQWRVFGVLADGSVRTTGYYRKRPQVEAAVNVAKVAAGNDNLLALHRDGTVEMLIATDNAVRQGMTQTGNWSDITDIAMGESHVVGLRGDGTVVATGSNHCGQCDVEDWTDIVFLTAGQNITLGITRDGDLRVAGELG